MPYYNNTNIGTPARYNTNKPGDDRLVVGTRDDLMNSATWSGRQLYDGIVVAVVLDGNNNGLYMLPWEDQSAKQSWDSSDVNTYDIDGWMYIGGAKTLLDESRLNEAVSPGSFTKNPDGEYYSDFINGGTF